MGNVTIEVMRLLLRRGAEVDLRATATWCTGHNTPLLELCLRNKRRFLLEEIKLLLDYGADPNLGPLHEAVTQDRDRYGVKPLRDGQLSVLRLLLEYGADVNRAETRRWRRKGTPLEIEEAPQIKTLLRKHMAITIRKCVIGGNAEHPARNRLKHLAPQIASFLV